MVFCQNENHIMKFDESFLMLPAQHQSEEVVTHIVYFFDFA